MQVVLDGQTNLLKTITKLIAGNDTNMTKVANSMLLSAKAISALQKLVKHQSEKIEVQSTILSIHGLTDILGGDGGGEST